MRVGLFLKTFMKASAKILHCSFAISLCFVTAGPAAAQTLTTLYDFSVLEGASGFFSGTNSDGGNPSTRLVLSGTALYGTTMGGGPSGYGTLFMIDLLNKTFSNIYSFNGDDGAAPGAALTLSPSALFGTTLTDGKWRPGTIFKLSTDGSPFATLHHFSSVDFYSLGTLLLLDQTLYGTTHSDGSLNRGSVFKLNTDGTGFTKIHTFTNTADGALPGGGLIFSGGKLYGTTKQGGAYGSGTVFSLGTDGSDFTNVYSFTERIPALPLGSLTLSSNVLYGTTFQGGSGQGSVFKVRTDGAGFTNLHSFTPLSGNSATNVDGANPWDGVVLSGDCLYGTTSSGGTFGQGTIFKVNTDGSGFLTLYHFSGGSDGGGPHGGVTLSGNTLHGTTVNGGRFGSGTVFSLSFVPQLSMTTSGTNLVLAWPMSYAGFDYTAYSIHSSTNLASRVWMTNLPAPVLVNGRYTVTNPILGTQQFFKLR